MAFRYPNIDYCGGSEQKDSKVLKTKNQRKKPGSLKAQYQEFLKKVAKKQGVSPKELEQELKKSADEVARILSKETPNCVQLVRLDQLKHITNCEYCKWQLRVLLEILSGKQRRSL